MISTPEKLKLKTILGNTYSQKVYDRLKQIGATNEDGTPISKGWIRVVFNGQREQKEIEDAIYFVAAEERKLQRQLKKQRQKLLG